jgi:ubiquinone/menaquinone biosynthesis C-methylase UbiE
VPTGLDLSQHAVSLSQECGYVAVKGSLSQLPLSDQSFDVVTLERVEDPVAALREVHRVLRPGGLSSRLPSGA